MKSSLLLLVSLAALAAAPALEIKIDQAGYLPGAPKIALVAFSRPAADFVIRKSANNAIAFRGTLSAPVSDADSGDTLQAADFSRLTRTGAYYLEVPGLGRSWNFSIAPDVYRRVYYLAMRSYYGQRCGTAVDLGPDFPGYRHPACHLAGAYHSSSGKSGPRESQGGWHDAGDYGRYVVNSGITTGTLLWTWEIFGPRIQKVDLKIPESGSRTPSILSEIRWNLDWLLTMQDGDGGVWHKQTSDRFCGFVMPDKDTLVSYVIGSGQSPFKTSCATADFAAVMAIAARVYRRFDPAFAAAALRAAQKAWTWLDRFPNAIFRNPPGISTGEYGDRDCADERLWAAAELWRTTRDAAFERYFLDHYEAFRSQLRPIGPQGWANLSNLALWTYALGGGADRGAVDAIRQDSLAAADRICERTAANPYHVSLAARDYIWGSNSVAANYAMQLLIANEMRKDPRYVTTALDDLHYLLGRNTFSLSFVTRVGDNPVRHPHHRPSGADNNPEPWPGLLAGGPNRGRQDAAMQKLSPTLPPARMYLDEQAAYSANEVAINWNAPLVFLLAAVQPPR